MGVRGLSTFLANRGDFFEKKQLRGSKVIIDGNNLRFALYKSCPGLNDCFGGDYDKFYRHVRRFFLNLLRCEVTPVIIVDGGLDKNDQKLKTVIKRLSEQTKCAVSCTSVTQAKLRVFPVFAKEVFYEVLSELSIEIHQSSFEADEVIANIAIRENCPVISNDSDFFIFNVDFILLSSINLSDFSEDEDFIECDIFKRQKMLDHYNISSVELLQLVAALIGNDYLAPEIFDKVFMNIKLVNKRRDMSERHRKIRSLLACLSKEICPANAIHRLLGFLPEKERKIIKDKIFLLMDTYNGKGNQSIISEDFTSYDGEQFPAWFVEEYHNCSLPNWFLSIMASRKYFLPSFVEIREKLSVHDCCMEIHKLLIQILSGGGEDVHLVRMYGRIKSSFGILDNIKVNHEKVEGICNLQQIREKSVEERIKVLQQVLAPNLDLQQLSQVPPHLRLLTMVFNSWSLASRVSEIEVKSILLCHLLLTEVDPKVNNIRNTKKLRTMAETDGDDEFARTASKLYHLFHMEESMKTNTRRYDPEIVHKLSQFQAILWVSNAFNQLLGKVYKLPKISELINCTFIFNCILQHSSVLRKEFLPVSLGDKFENMCSRILSCLKFLEEPATKVISGRKRHPKKKQQDKTMSESETLISENRSGEVDNFFDDENIFSVLKIE